MKELCCLLTVAGAAGTARVIAMLARLLNQAKLATLLVDLLTSDEEAIDMRTAHLRFDIGLLAERPPGPTARYGLRYRQELWVIGLNFYSTQEALAVSRGCCRGFHGVLYGACSVQRQINLKSSSYSRLAFHFDSSAVILDDPLTDGKS
jgi:hypothetical protein